MLNIIMWAIGIYLALVASSVTIMIVATSKWYWGKIDKLTRKFMEEFEEEV